MFIRQPGEFLLLRMKSDVDTNEKLKYLIANRTIKGLYKLTSDADGKLTKMARLPQLDSCVDTASVCSSNKHHFTASFTEAKK